MSYFCKRNKNVLQKDSYTGVKYITLKKFIMKKIFLFGVVAAISLLMTGCGFSKEAVSNQNQNQTSVVLSKNNYTIVKSVRGESTQTYVFGLIGGLSKKSLKESAMSEMVKNANLKGSQAIINVNVQYKNTISPIITQTTAIATGTIIEFTK